MIEFLERAAAADSEHVAVVTHEGSTTYGQLLARAHQVAAALAQLGIVRFAVVESDAARLLALLGGAALVGAEPCQYQPDTDPATLAEQCRAFGHDTIVTSRDDLGEAGRILAFDELVGEGVPDRAPDQPLLIRTTGTTGEPKAARHDWAVLGRTVERVGARTDQRWLLAYGPHQFAGIQVLLHVVAAQATLVAPFPRQPRDGLAAIAEHGVNCVSATPTYWRFLLQEARASGVALPALQQATLGGEAVPPDVLAAVQDNFPTARISQVYASTEHGSVASVTDGRPGIGTDKLFGPDNPTGTLKVVDGELWVRSSAGMLGYADDDGEPQPEADGWRATGDLAEIIGDRIEFRGRVSEVINVGGVKVPPLPVENRLNALKGVAAARVFGRANRLTGAIVAAEIVTEPGVDEDALRAEIRTCVSDLPRPWHPRSVTFVATLPTRGNKTIRSEKS